MIPSDIGKIIRTHRKERHLTQIDLATIAGFSPAAVARIEQGTRPDPYLFTLECLLEAVGCELCIEKRAEER